MDIGNVYRNRKTGFEAKKGEVVRIIDKKGREDVLVMDFGGDNFIGLTKTNKPSIKWWLLALKSIL